MNLESLTFFILGLAFGIILGIMGYYTISLQESKKKWTLLMLISILNLAIIWLFVFEKYSEKSLFCIFIVKDVSDRNAYQSNNRTYHGW